MATARAGVPVVLDRLRDWEPDDLIALARFFLYSPDLNVPIEPFFSTSVYLRPGGRAFALPSLYQGQPDRTPSIESPCATCEAFKCCRGFWRDSVCGNAGCETWREILALLVAGSLGDRSFQGRSPSRRL